jgi:hypothetical protein
MKLMLMADGLQLKVKGDLNLYASRELHTANHAYSSTRSTSHAQEDTVAILTLQLATIM